MIGIIGAGFGGLFCARALARAGREVTIFETDAPYAGESADDAFLNWQRPGVAQLRQPHAARSLIPKLLKQNDPELYAAIVAAGMVEWPFHLLSIEDPEVPHDPELHALLGRRPTLEVPLRRLVERMPNVRIVRQTVRQLLIVRSGARHRVDGVVTAEGAQPFELIVASPGRRSKLVEWLTAAGVPLPQEQTTECGITYYSRYFKFRPGVEIPRGPYPSGPSGSLPSVHYTMNRTDHDTFSFMLGVAPWRDEFRALRHNAVFSDFVASLPNVNTWLHPDKCTPLRSVEPFAGLVNRYRRYHDDSGPLVENLYVVGDSRFHTNPIYGWGMAMALHQSYLLRDAFSAEPDAWRRQVRFESQVDAFAHSYFEATSKEDAARAELWRGTRAADERGEPGTYRYFLTTVLPAVYRDQYIFRAVTRRMHLLDHPDAIHRDQELARRAERINASLDRSITEAQLLERVRAFAERHAIAQT